MSTREIQDQKAIAREMIVEQAAHAKADVSASPLRGDTSCSFKSRRDYTLESPAEDGFYELADTSFPVTRVDAANLVRVLRQLEVIAKRQAPRIAFKAKGRILFLDLAEIVAGKPKVITFRCDIYPIPICCASPSRPWRRSSSRTVLFASTARSL